MKTQIIVILTVIVSSVASNEIVSVAPREEITTELSSTSQPYYNAAVILTASILTGVGVVVLTVLFFPVMAYRVCYSLGGCQNTMDAYVDELIGKQLGRARNVRSRNKRSMEYLEPILVTLAKAYEQYGVEDDLTKNYKTASYYTK